MSRKALLIGINDYPQTPLSGCIEDINTLEMRLATNEDKSRNFSVRKLPNVLTSKDAMAAINDLFSGDPEIALLYFSGHGYANSIGAQLVFPDDLETSSYLLGIQMSDIMAVANNSRARNIIIILDCCHSGAMGDDTVRNSESLLRSGISIMTACRKDETAEERGGHGLFTELICLALDGGAADFCGNITIGGIYSYIDKALGPWEQRPVFKTNVSEFVPIRKVIPKVNEDTIRCLCDLFETPNFEFPLDPSFEDTNTPDYVNEKIEPYACEKNVKIFKILQELQSIGFVEPVGAPYMYFAAIHSKSCKLTELGKYYWRLVKSKQI